MKLVKHYTEDSLTFLAHCLSVVGFVRDVKLRYKVQNVLWGKMSEKAHFFVAKWPRCNVTATAVDKLSINPHGPRVSFRYNERKYSNDSIYESTQQIHS